MKKLLIQFLLGGIMFGANLKFITISDVEIPVIYEQSNIVPTGAIQLVFSGSGSIYNEHGLAYLASLLLNEGTKELGSTQFARLLEEKAISLHISSSKEFLEFDLSFLKEQETEAINLLGMLLQSPNITEDSLSKVKDQAISALLARENDYDYLANLGLLQMIFKNTPLQFPSTGDTSSIQAVTLDQIRSYIQSALSLNRLNIIIGGDLEIDSSLGKISALLSKLPVGEKVIFQRYEANGDAQTKTQYKPTEQAYIYFGSPFALENYKQDAYKAKVMSFILGSSGFGSRMMNEIRVKHGLAYSAYMKINLSQLTSYASGYLQTKISNQNQAIELVKEVIQNFIREGVTEEELQNAKNFLLGSEPLRNETLSQRLKTAFSNYHLGLELDYQKEELDKIHNLTLEELNAFIKSHKEILRLSFSILTK